MQARGVGGSVSAVCQKDGFAQHDQADQDDVGQKQLKGYPEVLNWRFCKAHEVRQHDHSEKDQHRSADAAQDNAVAEDARKAGWVLRNAANERFRRAHAAKMDGNVGDGDQGNVATEFVSTESSREYRKCDELRGIGNQKTCRGCAIGQEHSKQSGCISWCVSCHVSFHAEKEEGRKPFLSGLCGLWEL